MILELDEHDSSVGYKTRIEAAVRAFRNHNDVMNQDPHFKRCFKDKRYGEYFVLKPLLNIMK